MGKWQERCPRERVPAHSQYRTVKTNSLAAWVLLLFSAASAGAATTNIFSFTSSPQSYVGQGRSFFITPADHYLFTTTRQSSNVASFLIASRNSPFGPDWNPASGEEYHDWTLDLAAPDGQALVVGLYTGAARFPFQGPMQPGLTLAGDGRGNNANAGFFQILEIARTPSGEIDRIAVDFTQYDETFETWWVIGQLRFNSAIPTYDWPRLISGSYHGTGQAGFDGRRKSVVMNFRVDENGVITDGGVAWRTPSLDCPCSPDFPLTKAVITKKGAVRLKFGPHLYFIGKAKEDRDSVTGHLIILGRRSVFGDLPLTVRLTINLLP